MKCPLILQCLPTYQPLPPFHGRLVVADPPNGDRLPPLADSQRCMEGVLREQLQHLYVCTDVRFSQFSGLS